MDSPPHPSREEAKRLFARHVSRGKVAAFEQFGVDVVMGRRDGARFFDAYSQRSWIDCHSNGGVFNLGHRHPAIVAAVREALDHLDIGNHHLVSGYRAALASRLAESSGGRLSGAVFAAGGGEATDLAIKVCRAQTGRRGIVSVLGGYHGHTGLALATGDAQYRDPFGPNLPGFVQVEFDSLAALDVVVDDDTAAVILEPIPATLGMRLPSDGYLEGVERLCRERGAKLILDEVQTGLGRTGAIWFHRLIGLEPDVVVTGKGLSGGIYPIAATLMTRELHSFFDERPFVHISTFGGSEIGCVAGLAVMDVLEAPGFLDRTGTLARRFAESFAPCAFELRQRGMFMGFKFAAVDGGLAASRALFDEGVFAAFANNDHSVLQFLPPLTIDDETVDELIKTVRRVFS